MNANPTHNGTNGTDLTPLNMSAGPAQLAIDNLPMMNQHSLNLRMNNGNVPDSMQNNKVDKIGMHFSFEKNLKILVSCEFSLINIFVIFI